MKPFHLKQFYCLFTFLCFHTLAMARCQNGEENNIVKCSENSAAISDAANDSVKMKKIILDDTNGGDYNPVIDSANFASAIDNPYFTLTPGKVWVYKGTDDEGKTERVEVEV